MRNKKKDEPEKTPEQEALEQRVDAMMDPNKPDEAPVATAEPPVAEKPAVKVPGAGKGTKTAPRLSTKLRKQIGAADVPAKPLSIDKLDALTESIAEPETPSEPEAPETPDITEQSMELNDSRTDEAVDDIVSYEGDVMLAIADSTAAERNKQVAPIPDKKGTHHTFATIIWTLVFLIVVIAIVLGWLLVTGGNMPNLPNLPKL
jgi:hypothetical protein